MPKSVGSFLALDQIINKSFDQLTTFLAFDQTHYWKFWSSEKSQKIGSTENETFDQLKKDSFGQVKFDQVINPPKRYFVKQIKSVQVNLG
jgi:hypothetical protein